MIYKKKLKNNLCLHFLIKGDESGRVNARRVQVEPIEPDDDNEVDTREEKIVKEEGQMWEELGGKGFRPGSNGELPEGFHFDEEGNVVVS